MPGMPSGGYADWNAVLADARGKCLRWLSTYRADIEAGVALVPGKPPWTDIIQLARLRGWT